MLKTIWLLFIIPNTAMILKKGISFNLRVTRQQKEEIPMQYLIIMIFENFFAIIPADPKPIISTNPKRETFSQRISDT